MTQEDDFYKIEDYVAFGDLIARQSRLIIRLSEKIMALTEYVQQQKTEKEQLSILLQDNGITLPLSK